MENGKVVGLLDTDPDGLVDSLDATGDNERDDLDVNGWFLDEVKGLGTEYRPGTTWRRVSLRDFSPDDTDWPGRAPSDATAPNAATSPERSGVSVGHGLEDVSGLGKFAIEIIKFKGISNVARKNGPTHPQRSHGF